MKEQLERAWEYLRVNYNLPDNAPKMTGALTGLVAAVLGIASDDPKVSVIAVVVSVLVGMFAGKGAQGRYTWPRRDLERNAVGDELTEEDLVPAPEALEPPSDDRDARFDDLDESEFEVMEDEEVPEVD